MITLTNGELLLTNDLTILGPGATNLSVSGNSQTRVLEIGSNITANISGLTIRDGHGAGAATNGGGLYNAGILKLSNCTITSNSAAGAPWGFGSDAAGAAGGAIYNVGTLVLSYCSLTRNSAGDGGTGPAYHAPGAPGASGGGIYNGGALSLAYCTIADNRAGNGGSGAFGGYQGGPGGTGAWGGDGGGIWNASSVEAMGCTFSGNFAGKGGGGGGLIPATEAVVPMVVLEVPFATWAC